MTEFIPDIYCLRGEGRYYVCEGGSKFVGCCKRNPCHTTCEDEHLLPTYFNTSVYGKFPDLDCDSGDFYTCTASEPSGFNGCCRVNACQQERGVGCPPESLSAAYLPENPKRAAYYLNLSASSSLRHHNVANHLESTRLVLGEVPAPPRSIPAIAVAGLVLFSLGVALPIASVLLCLSRLIRSKVKRSAPDASESTPFTSESTTSLTFEMVETSRQQSHRSVMPQPAHKRTQPLPLASIVGPAIINAVLIGFLGFLWFGEEGITVWDYIVAAEWVTQSITITTLVIRHMVNIQAGISAAMLAALVLESSQGVKLADVAALSILRYRASPLSIIKLVARGLSCKGVSFRALRFPILSLLLVMTSVSLQSSSVMLVSDLELRSLSGFPQKNRLPVDFQYSCIPSLQECRDVWFNQIPRGTAWAMNPPSYPTFGEYIEPVDDAQAEQDDTGVILRAFLPMADAESRKTLRNHTGPALVIDARVSCQAPTLDDVAMSAPFYGNVSGTVTNSTSSPGLQPILPTKFLCTFAGPGQVSICQIGDSYAFLYIGSLESQFKREDSTYGTAFLVMDPAGDLGKEKNVSASDLRTNKTVSSKRGAWTELTYPSINSTLSISLCFAPWDAARLNVNMYSSQNRTEPSPQWNAPTANEDVGRFDMDPVLHQLGLHPNTTTTKSTTPESRGILTLEKPRSLTPTAGGLPAKQRPFTQADMSGAGGGSSGITVPLAGNWTTFLSGHPLASLLNNFTYTPGGAVATTLAADPAVAGLFNGAFRASSNGSVARALSAVVTVLSATAYYGQLPAFDFVPSSSEADGGDGGDGGGVEQVYFRTVLMPVRARGFAAVVWLLAAHTAVVSAIMVVYERRVSVSLLGEAWASMVHVRGSICGSLYEMGNEEVDARSGADIVGVMEDNEMGKVLEKKEGGTTMVRIVVSNCLDGRTTSEIVRVKE